MIKMHLPTLIKYLLLAWGLPIAIVFVVRAFTPDPGAARGDFSRQSFKPARAWIADERGTKGSDHFELRIENPEGEIFYRRDPEREPVEELYGRFATTDEISILYSSSRTDGNMLMEVVAEGGLSPMTILSFDEVMEEYGSRRRFVYGVAAVWWCLANLFSFALWKVDVSPPPHG